MISSAKAAAPDTDTKMLPSPARPGNGRYWFAVLVIFWIVGRCLFKEVETSEAIVPYPEISAIWGVGTIASWVAILFARTNGWTRIVLGMLSFTLTTGFAESLNYSEFLSASALAVLLMVLVTVAGFYRARFMSNLWYARQVLFVRCLCLLILVTTIIAFAVGCRMILTRDEQRYEYLFFGIQDQLNKSLNPVQALAAHLELDDSSTSNAVNRQHAELLSRQVSVLKNNRERVAAMEVPRRYRKLHKAYLDFLATGISVNNAAALAAEAADVEAQEQEAEDSFTKTVPALRHYLEAQRAAGLPISEELLQTLTESDS